MEIVYESIAGWPPLAWIAACDRTTGQVRVRHGPSVETRDDWFCEAVWAGEFGEGDFDRTDLIVGSGARLRDGRLVFVSSGTTVDRLQSLETTERVLVSNSLPCLMETADAAVDPTYANYYRDFRSITEGLEGYKRLLETSRGAVTLTYFRNLVWDGISLSIHDKPHAERRFDSFEAYRAFLIDTVERIGRNMAAPERNLRFRPLGTLSSGYDSAAVAVLAQHAGLEEVICFNRARGGGDDDGTPTAERLGLRVIHTDRWRWRTIPEAFAPFGAVNAYGEEVHYAALADVVAGSVLFSGYHGDAIWEKDEKNLEPEFMRKDPSGLSLSEFRLRVGFIHCPLPFLGVRRKAGLHHICVSPEMGPWDVGGDYSKPIPRRIIEEAGVPRGTFGVLKRATAIVLWQPKEGFLPPVELDNLRSWLAHREDKWASIGAVSPLARKRRARLLSALLAPARSTLALMWRIPAARSLARRIAQLDPHQQTDPLFDALFPWALDRAKARYRLEPTAADEPVCSFAPTRVTPSGGADGSAPVRWFNGGVNLQQREMLSRIMLSYTRFWAKMILKVRRPIIIGVTGSVGKTTTVDVISAVLLQPEARAVVGSVGKAYKNLNDEWGLPQAILGFKQAGRFRRRGKILRKLVQITSHGVYQLFNCPRLFVLEYGAHLDGHLHDLVRLAPPHVAVVTAVGPAHLEGLGTVAGVAREKSALLTALKPTGLAIFGDENPHLEEMAQMSRAPVKVVSGRGIALAGNLAREVGSFFRVPTDAVQRGIAECELPERRLNTFTNGGFTIIDDSINANPLSMKLALDVLAQYASDGQRKVAVLGPMAELGAEGPQYHDEIGLYAKGRADLIIGIGELSVHYGAEFVFPTVEDFIANGMDAIQTGDIVLVKGSASARLKLVSEHLVDRFLAAQHTAGNVT